MSKNTSQKNQGIHDKSIATMILNREKNPKAFPQNQEENEDVYHYHSPNIVLEVLAGTLRQEAQTNKQTDLKNKGSSQSIFIGR